MKISIKKLVICSAIEILIFILVIFSRNIMSAENTKAILLCLCDGFFTAGALMLISAGLAWTNSQGVSDGISYSISRFFKRRGTGYEEYRRESYSDYKERKHSKKPKLLEMLLSSLFFIAISLILLIFYSKAV